MQKQADESESWNEYKNYNYDDENENAGTFINGIICIYPATMQPNHRRVQQQQCD